ncbi:MAG: hypothetical protein HY281_04125 [Nitrospirae bacterium]|nr:hypothetical protein [Nitrospirota bacterium]
MTEFYKKPTDAVAVFRQLGTKLNRNCDLALGTEQDQLQKVEVKARAFAETGRILSGLNNLTATQHECTCIFDEIFGDIICSLYFAASALDKPAQILLRRVLELGVAAVYLWDLPHKYWGWKCHDEDLSFKEMLGHLTSDSYRTYLAKLNPNFTDTQILDAELAKTIYRDLSDITHGKLGTFESVSPDRYNFTTEDWQKHLNLANSVEDILLKLWSNRFKEVTAQLPISMPQLSRLA